MSRTITKVFADRVQTTPMSAGTSTTNFNFSATGAIPGLLVEYTDGDKFLILVPSAASFSFENKSIVFNTEDYAWNDKLSRWDRTQTGALTAGMKVNNTIQVEVTNGRDRSSYYKLVDDLEQPYIDPITNTVAYRQKEELIDAEDVPTSFMGEFDFWMAVVGRTAIVPPIHDTLEEFFIKALPETE